MIPKPLDGTRLALQHIYEGMSTDGSYGDDVFQHGIAHSSQKSQNTIEGVEWESKFYPPTTAQLNRFPIPPFTFSLSFDSSTIVYPFLHGGENVTTVRAT